MAEEVKNSAGAEAATAVKSKAPIVVIIVVVLVAVLGAVGFLFFRDSIMPTKGIGGVVLSPDCKFNDKDLCKFMNNFKGLNDFSANSTTTMSGKKTESKIEMQGTEKSHFVTTVDGKEESNMISIGKTTYLKDKTDNKWWKSTQADSATSEPKSDWKAEFDKELNDKNDKTTYKKIAKEACGSLTCLKYQVLDPANTETTQYIWFDTKEYLLRKTTDEAKGVVTETAFTYNKVNVTEPSPVKEMNQEDVTKSLLNSGADSGAAGQQLTPDQVKQLESLGAGAPTE